MGCLVSRYSDLVPVMYPVPTEIGPESLKWILKLFTLRCHQLWMTLRDGRMKGWSWVCQNSRDRICFLLSYRIVMTWQYGRYVWCAPLDSDWITVYPWPLVGCEALRVGKEQLCWIWEVCRKQRKKEEKSYSWYLRSEINETQAGVILKIFKR